jgi:hypothetical protein
MIYVLNGGMYEHYLTSRGPASLSYFRFQKMNAKRASDGGKIELTASQMADHRLQAAAKLQIQSESVKKQQQIQTQLAKYAALSKHNSKAIASTYLYKADVAWNKHRAAIVHHWGAGGGGSHYNMGGSRQFQKGLRLKGVVSRHSKQAAQRNTPCLRGEITPQRVFGRTSGTSFKEKSGGGKKGKAVGPAI